MSRALYVFIAAFAVAYYAILSSGLIAPKPAMQEFALYSLPLMNASFAALLLALYRAIVSARGARLMHWVWFAAVGLVCAGYWINATSSYIASFVITEGQTVDAAYIQEASSMKYTGKYSKPPLIDLTLSKVEPAFTDDGRALRALSARFISEGTEFSLDDTTSIAYKGMRMSIADLGYSPRYELTKDGRLLDSAFVYLHLFPPGSEDAFRLLSPLTYYLRYYPEGGGHPARYGLRVARNKYLIYNGDIAPAEVAIADDAGISFPEIRMWTKVTLRREPGGVLMVAGIVLGLAVLALACAVQEMEGRDV